LAFLKRGPQPRDDFLACVGIPFSGPWVWHRQWRSGHCGRVRARGSRPSSVIENGAGLCRVLKGDSIPTSFPLGGGFARQASKPAGVRNRCRTFLWACIRCVKTLLVCLGECSQRRPPETAWINFK
jgi:hypothetical protein